MSAKQKTVDPINYMPTSLKDAGYQGARSSETLASIAGYVMTLQPTIAEEGPTKETQQGLREGWMLRYSELHKGQRYTKDWNPIPEGHDPVDGEMSVTVQFALSFTQQEFGKMKSADPGKYGAVKGMRGDFNKYAHNRMEDLMTVLKRIAAHNKPRTRDAAKDYKDWLTATFDTMKARAKTAKARGDATVPDEAKLRVAIDAFNKALA